MMQLLADLHIHTALSPCASASMTPSRIVQMAASRGISIIAICDHNAAGNAGAVQQAVTGEMQVIAGIEITTSEDVHLVGLFPDAPSAMAVAAKVKETLPELTDPPSWMGEQLLFDAQDRVIGREPKMLAASSGWALSDAVELIRAHQGLAIAAHVDRASFSVISQLGMMPIDVTFDALEVSPAGIDQDKHVEFAREGRPIVSGSDSHDPEDIGTGLTVVEALGASFAELRLALAGEGGRRCWVA